jgi:hypothetical protein
MRDKVAKMAELKFEAPLAKFEEAEDWGPPDLNILTKEDDVNLNNVKNKEICDNQSNLIQQSLLAQTNNTEAASASSEADNFTETFSGSLEDLVNTFDDKITRCFCNYDESVEKLAPVQVRTQEEIMNECQ